MKISRRLRTPEDLTAARSTILALKKVQQGLKNLSSAEYIAEKLNESFRFI